MFPLLLLLLSSSSIVHLPSSSTQNPSICLYYLIQFLYCKTSPDTYILIRHSFLCISICFLEQADHKPCLFAPKRRTPPTHFGEDSLLQPNPKEGHIFSDFMAYCSILQDHEHQGWLICFSLRSNSMFTKRDSTSSAPQLDRCREGQSPR